MLDERVRRRLIEIFGDRVLFDPEILSHYSADAMCEPGAMPAAVVFPTSTEEVSQLMKLAYEHEIPVYVRGGGTSLSGGAMVVEEGAIVCCMTKMNRILDVRARDFQALVEAGITVDELNVGLSRYNLFWPPDPASSPAATVGGCIAHNAGGVRAIKYGVTRNWVLGLELVLPDGTVVWTGRGTFKRSAGYDLTQLIVGSEGTLAIVTKALLKLAPVPRVRVAVYAFFDDERTAAETIYDLIMSGADLTAAEFLDRVTLRALSRYMGFEYTGNAMVLSEVSGNDPEIVKRHLSLVERVFREHRALAIRRCESREDYEYIWRVRKGAAPALASIKPKYLVLDPTVPLSKIADLVDMIRRVCEKHGVECGTFGHLGDGNVHPNLLYDPKDEEEIERVRRAAKEITRETIRLGGTISGEHGIGVEKAEFLPEEVGDRTLALMKMLKRVFDPKNILNRGKLLR